MKEISDIQDYKKKIELGVYSSSDSNFSEDSNSPGYRQLPCNEDPPFSDPHLQKQKESTSTTQS